MFHHRSPHWRQGFVLGFLLAALLALLGSWGDVQLSANHLTSWAGAFRLRSPTSSPASTSGASTSMASLTLQDEAAAAIASSGAVGRGPLKLESSRDNSTTKDTPSAQPLWPQVVNAMPVLSMMTEEDIARFTEAARLEGQKLQSVKEALLSNGTALSPVLIEAARKRAASEASAAGAVGAGGRGSLLEPVAALDNKHRLVRRDARDCACRPPLAAIDSTDSDLNRDLVRIAAAAVADANNDILLMITTGGDVEPQLILFLEQTNRLKMQNILIIAVDDEGFAACSKHSWPCVRATAKVGNFGRDHREFISAMKFVFIRDLLRAGFNVLLADSDIVLFDNPFHYFSRTHDVEGMSDGWTPRTAYGETVAFEDPPLPMPWYYRHVLMNSGFFYVRASVATYETFALIAVRLERQNIWDQAAFNEEVLKPYVGNQQLSAYGGHQLRVKILDYRIFANSKVALHDPVWEANNMAVICPVILHVNYHGRPKRDRMEDALKKYAHCL